MNVQEGKLPPNNKIKVLATDLDHTLFPPDTETLPERFPNLVSRWRGSSRAWIVATGRSVGDLQAFYREWPVLPDYTIARERFIIQHVGSSWFPHRAWNQKLMMLSREVLRRSRTWVERLLEAVEDRSIFERVEERYVVFRKLGPAQRWTSWLEDRLPRDLRPLRNRNYLGFRSNQFGKGICLRRILRARRWPASSVLAVGDSANDDDMLDGRFGYASAAVNNAESKAKEWVRDAGGAVLKEPGGTAVVKLLRYLLESTGGSRRSHSGSGR